MSRKIDMDDVYCELNGIVAILNIFYEMYSGEVASVERYIKENNSTLVGKNFVHRSYEMYEPAINQVCTSLFYLLKRVEEAVA